MKFDRLSYQQRWAREAEESDLGLWWLADDIRETLAPAATEREVCRSTLDVLRPLLLSGSLRSVDLLAEGKFALWPGAPEDHLARIEKEWLELGREPEIGEIVWFIGARTTSDGLS